MRVAVVEGRDHLVVVTVRLPKPQELDALYEDRRVQRDVGELDDLISVWGSRSRSSVMATPTSAACGRPRRSTATAPIAVLRSWATGHSSAISSATLVASMRGEATRFGTLVRRTPAVLTVSGVAGRRESENRRDLQY